MYYYIRMKTPKTENLENLTLRVKLPLLSGSISTARSTCGKPQCPCHQDPAKRHGVYYRWTGFLEGKRTTKTLSQAEARECQARIKNYRKLQKTVDELILRALKNAPWTKRKKARQAEHP
jgi:hypothetical protein